MKPIIIIAEELNGKILVDKAEFLKMIQDAYEQGRQDGNTYLPNIPYIQHPCEPYPSWVSTTVSTDGLPPWSHSASARKD